MIYSKSGNDHFVHFHQESLLFTALDADAFAFWNFPLKVLYRFDVRAIVLPPLMFLRICQRFQDFKYVLSLPLGIQEVDIAISFGQGALVHCHCLILQLFQVASHHMRKKTIKFHSLLKG
jgi:hypothetical protein